MIRPSEIADKAWLSWATLVLRNHIGGEDQVDKPPKAIGTVEPSLAGVTPPTPKWEASHMESIGSPEML